MPPAKAAAVVFELDPNDVLEDLADPLDPPLRFASATNDPRRSMMQSMANRNTMAFLTRSHNKGAFFSLLYVFVRKY